MSPMGIVPFSAPHHQALTLNMTTMTTMTTRRLRKREPNRVSKPMRTPSCALKLNRLGFLLAMIRDAAEIGRQKSITITNTNAATSNTTSLSSSSSSSSSSLSTHTVDSAEGYEYFHDHGFDYDYSRYGSYLPVADEDAYSYPRSRHASVSSTFSCEALSGDERRELWMCMLELQMRYGCYNSTRMHLAVNAGDDAVNLMPNPFILDTLNNSLVHLPEEGWEMLSRHLRHDEAAFPCL